MLKTPSKPHFKLEKIRILDKNLLKGHNKVTKTVLSLLRSFMRQTLITTARFCGKIIVIPVFKFCFPFYFSVLDAYLPT